MTSISMSWSGIRTNNMQIQAPRLARSGSADAGLVLLKWPMRQSKCNLHKRHNPLPALMQVVQEAQPFPTGCSYASCTLIATSATPTVPSHSCSILISDGTCTCILVVMQCKLYKDKLKLYIPRTMTR